MDWRDVVPKLRRTRVSRDLEPLLGAMAPGQKLYLIRPIVSRKSEWTAPWTSLVKRRTFQWARAVRTDQRFQLQRISNAWLQVGHRNGAVRGELYVKKRR
jgi:hypothetical protein